MIYLDSNVYINAAINREKTGDSCRHILESIVNGVTEAATSALTFDEVLWKLRGMLGYRTAIQNVRMLLDLPIYLIPVDAEIVQISLNIASSYLLKPRDSIHIACMQKREILDICSTDPDFDIFEGIKRFLPTDFKG